MAVVGESGSGKTVTALSIMGLLEEKNAHCRGNIFLEHAGKKVDLNQLPPGDMRCYRGNEMAMIFQEPMTSLNPVFTCGSQVTEAIRAHAKISQAAARQRTITLFEKVSLPFPEKIFDRYPHQLSGGQKQRVMIAMAMSCRPRLLVADEPTTALDTTVQRSILQLIRSLQQETAMSVLFITHDLNLAATIADRIMVMYKGTIVEEGPVKDVFSNPAHPYTKGLLACRPAMDKTPDRLPVISDFMIEEQGQLREVSPLHADGKDAHRHEGTTDKAEDVVLSLQEVTTAFPLHSNWLGKPTAWNLAVDHVSFDIYQGEMMGLVGESGSGKTTLGRSILQLVKPASGHILFKGIDLCRLGSRQWRPLRARIQLIFQDPYSSLDPRQTIGEALVEPLRVHHCFGSERERKKQAQEMLEKVGLDHTQYHRYPHEFSGGQRQRICIARALILQPELVICDECVAALDMSVQAQVLNLLRDMQEELGFTGLFISHDLAVVKFMCSRVVVMNKGKVEEAGSSEAIYHHPQSDYTRKLLEAIPQPPRW